jgi:hypothetical protein
MWDQVLTLAVLLFGIKGLALEAEQKSSVVDPELFEGSGSGSNSFGSGSGQIP